MGKQVLFISYDGMTDPLGQSQVIPYLVGLTKFGYSFTILSCDKPDRFARHGAYVKDLLAPYPVEWVSIPYHKNPAVLSSWYDYAMLKKTAARLHRERHFDLVHTRVGTPALVGYWLKKNLGIKFLNDIRGFWADERIDGGIWDLNNPVYRYLYHHFKKRETECIISADYNVCLTRAARAEIHSWRAIPGQPAKIEVIPCCTDMDLFDPGKVDQTAKQQLKNSLNINEGELVISYLGSIGGWYLTEEMMQFCKRVYDRIPAVKFLFISPHLQETIAATAVKYGLPAETLIVKPGLRHEVPLLLSLSHYSLFFIKPCYSKISSSPSKHGEIMAMGIPVITNEGVGDVAEIVTASDSGYVLRDFSGESFDEIIDRMVAGNTFDQTVLRKAAREFYSLSKAIELYRGVYYKILGE
jgi:glycosyltransferase involved in cell wall biosynthesis